MSPELEPEQWLICPVCKEPNPAGTRHCRYCLAASVRRAKPISSEQLAEYTRQRQLRSKRLRMLKIVTISVVVPLLLFLAVFLGFYSLSDVIFPPPADLHSDCLPGQWTMFRHDLARSGNTGASSTQPHGTLKWVFPTDGPIHSSPTVVGDTIYFGSRDGRLYAVDTETGVQRWEFKTGSWIESSPAVVDGIVYFGSNDSKLYALDAGTGGKLWEFDTLYPIKSSPAVADGLVCFGGWDRYVHALDAVTGAEVWSFRTGHHISSSPAIAGGILYVGSNGGNFYALQADNGRFRYRFKTYWATESSPAVDEGTVYLNSHGYLYALDGSARSWPGEYDLRSWWIQFYAFRLAPSPPPVSGFLWGKRLGRESTSSPVIVDGGVYTTADSRLCFIDFEKDRIVGWSFWTGGTIRSSPALGNGVIYVGSDDGRLYAIDATRGKKIWDFPTQGRITSSPCLADGVIYICSHDGSLYAIE